MAVVWHSSSTAHEYPGETHRCPQLPVSNSSSGMQYRAVTYADGDDRRRTQHQISHYSPHVRRSPRKPPTTTTTATRMVTHFISRIRTTLNTKLLSSDTSVPQAISSAPAADVIKTVLVFSCNNNNNNSAKYSKSDLSAAQTKQQNIPGI